jgi:integrase
MHNFSSKKWKPILLAAGVDYWKMYSIRHTCIAFCVNGGMDAKDVAKLVGIVQRLSIGTMQGENVI